MNGITVDHEALIALAVNAAVSGDTETLRRAIAAGVDVNTVSVRGDSLLMLACYYGHTETVRALLDRAADPKCRDAKGQTPLAGVAFKGLLDVAALLVEAGAEIDARSGYANCS
jgi:ankyrin repeat protein